MTLYVLAQSFGWPALAAIVALAAFLAGRVSHGIVSARASGKQEGAILVRLDAQDGRLERVDTKLGILDEKLDTLTTNTASHLAWCKAITGSGSCPSVSHVREDTGRHGTIAPAPDPPMLADSIAPADGEDVPR